MEIKVQNHLLWVILYKINICTWGQLESLNNILNTSCGWYYNVSNLFDDPPFCWIPDFVINMNFLPFFVFSTSINSTLLISVALTAFLSRIPLYVVNVLFCLVFINKILNTKNEFTEHWKQVQFITVKTYLIWVSWQLNFEINSDFNQISKLKIRVELVFTHGQINVMTENQYYFKGELEVMCWLGRRQENNATTT